MALDPENEKKVDFYLRRICSRADDIYRMAYILTADENNAKHLTEQVCDHIVLNLEQIMRQKDELPAIAKALSIVYQKPTSQTGTAHSSFKNLNRDELFAFAFVDYFGLSVAYLAEIHEKSIDEVIHSVASARAKLINNQRQLDEAAIDFFGHISEFLDETLDEVDHDRIQQLISSAEFAAELESFKLKRGILQKRLHSFVLDEDFTVALTHKIRSKDASLAYEGDKIQEVEMTEPRHRQQRGLILTLIGIILIYGFYRMFSPSAEPDLKILDALAYEASMLSKDKSRLNLPSEDYDEITRYLGNYPDLSFEPQIPMHSFSNDWLFDGATVIDYGARKVAVVQMHNTYSQDKVFYFSLHGSLDDLPRSQQGSYESLRFQAYASDEFNLIALENTPKTLSLFVGRLSAEDLAKIAFLGSPH